MHTPVLLSKVTEGLNISQNGLYIDATVGEGGHLWELAKIAKSNNFYPVDGVLFDLGLSIDQMQKSARGFSYKNLKEPLDMRISLDLDKSAADIVNNFDQNQIYEILANFSEEINSLAISRAIVRARSLKDVNTVGDLVGIVNRSIGYKDTRVQARVFQALRIAVNNELENLKKGLAQAFTILKDNSRLVAISFHSLEDRIVKQFIKNNAFELKQLNKKVIRSDRGKRFERSAKLRIVQVKKL